MMRAAIFAPTRAAWRFPWPTRVLMLTTAVDAGLAAAAGGVFRLRGERGAVRRDERGGGDERRTKSGPCDSSSMKLSGPRPRPASGVHAPGSGTA